MRLRVTSEDDAELFERLRYVRSRIAAVRGAPAYQILHDSALRSLADALPRSRRDLLKLEGIGQRKVEEFGDLFLQEVTRYLGETDVRRPGRRKVGESATLSIDLFEQGRTVEQIATQRSLAVGTIEGHLAQAVETGALSDLDRLVPERDRPKIVAAILELGDGAAGDQALGPLKERLGGDISYGQIRLVQAWLRRRRELERQPVPAEEMPPNMIPFRARVKGRGS